MLKSNKKLQTIWLFIVIVSLLLLFLSIPTAFAFQNTELSISTEDDTTIISNIENYMHGNNFLYSTVYKEKQTQSLLKTIGYSDNQIMGLSNDDLKSFENAKKIYTTSQEFYYDDNPETEFQTFSSVDPPIYVNHKKVTVKFTVIDEGSLLNNRRTFKLITDVDWNLANPVCRFTDIIATAWTGNALHAGSIQSEYSMGWEKQHYVSGNLVNETYETASSNLMEEYDDFPKFAVSYNLPGNTLIPQYIYRYMWLRSSTRVTATGDFVACTNYGHKKIAGTASVKLSESGLSIGISFNYVMDEFYPGTIRVYL